MIKMSKMHKRVLRAQGAMLALSAALSAALPPPAMAQADTAQAEQKGQLQTVTVTAQRRAENIKDVPVAVTLVRGERLDVLTSGGQDIRVLAGKTPSLNIESSNGRTFPRFYIRGYGNTDFNTFASQPVSLIYDDVVQENPILKGFPIFDLAGVEVLRGPQGTLFGRNTPAGVVKFESEKPKLDQFGGYYNLSWATHNTVNVDGAVNLPINQAWALRFSTLRQHRDDYVDNVFTNQKDSLDGYNEHAERLQLLYKPDGAFNALFNVHQRSTTGSSRLFRANVIKKGSNDLIDDYDAEKVFANGQNYQDLGTRGASLRLSWDLGTARLFSVSGYENVEHYLSRGDIDGGTPTGPGFIPFQVETAGGVSDTTQYSQEFRIESTLAGPLNWQAGIYLFSEDANGYSNGFNSTSGAQISHLSSHQKNDASAIFGSLNYAVSDALTVRGGLRYTSDKKHFNTVSAVNVTQIGPSSVDESSNKVNWDLSGTYKLTPNVNLYARLATGFRAPSIAAASAAVPITVADAETITSVEAGIKADLFERRARAAFSVYDYRIKNQQLTVVGGNSNVNRLINAAKTNGYGAEFDVEGFVTPSFKVSAGGSYNFTEIRDPSLSVNKCAQCTVTNPVNAAGRVVIDGNPLPQAPKWIFNATARYAMALGDGEMFVFTDVAYRSKINFFLYESVEFTGKPLTEAGVRVGYTWADRKYEVAAYSRNVSGTERITGGIDFNNLTGFTNEPRIVGVQFKGSF
jgi:iron complex outermembrane receptor protein